jgi:hypothetical protein
MQQFFEQHKQRLTVYQLPSYSPDYNPIEKLWKEVKKEGTHLHCFPTFQDLINKVEEALAIFEETPRKILSLFGMYHELSSNVSATAWLNAKNIFLKAIETLNEEFTWRREPFLADQVERYIGPLFGELLRGVLERSHRLSLDLRGEC